MIGIKPTKVVTVVRKMGLNRLTAEVTSALGGDMPSRSSRRT